MLRKFCPSDKITNSEPPGVVLAACQGTASWWDGLRTAGAMLQAGAQRAGERLLEDQGPILSCPGKVEVH